MTPTRVDLPMDFSRRAASLLMLAVVIATAAVRFRLLWVPLERDEGEYAYIGWRMLEGVPPYAEAYTMKLPGIHAAYAGILAVLGHSPAAIHTGLIVINAAAVVLVYLLGRRYLSRLGSVSAAAIYAVLSLGSPVHGFAANAEHFVLVPVLAGFCWLLKDTGGPRRMSIAGAGLCLGAAFVVKQPALVYVALGLTWLIWSWKLGTFRSLREFVTGLALYLAAAAAPFAATCLWMKAAGTFESFWRWTVEYPRSYAAQVAWPEGVDHFLAAAFPIALFAAPAFLLALIGLVVSLGRETRSTRGMFLVLLGLFSFLAVCPGLYFRQHYFLFLMPVVSLAAGAAVAGSARGIQSPGPLVRLSAVAGVLGWSLSSDRDILFRMTPDQVSRTVFGENPFVESSVVAEAIQRATPPGARVAILGSEPQMLFLAGRRSATGFLYMYPLTEEHPSNERMQRQMIAEIEAADPELVAVVTVPMSWLYRSTAPRVAIDWMNDALLHRYVLESLIPVGEPGAPRVLSGAEAQAGAAQFPVAVKLLRRREDH